MSARACIFSGEYPECAVRVVSVAAFFHGFRTGGINESLRVLPVHGNRSSRLLHLICASAKERGKGATMP
jgi:hypothetical protein